MTVLKPIMFVGTASDVGKSIINTGFCRIFKQDGFNPAPFKAQNMSLNSYATPDGLEIGRAQAVQAEACGIDCHTDMNPVLLKPSSEKSSQIVLNGKPAGNQSAYDYFMGNNKQELFKEVIAAYDRLSQKYNPVVMEGAGSISELNLKHRDITNMRMALYANADTYLVADIDRGGVFASIYGTIALLPPEEKALIKGVIINKFRGDSRLFEDGRKKIEELCGIPVVGVVPYSKGLDIEQEDSVALQQKQFRQKEGRVNVVVVLLKRLSNYTDFSALERDDRVHLFYSHDPSEIAKADIIILPGSKNTIADLIDIRNSEVAQVIVSAFYQNKTVIGICGGYQMMGLTVNDPLHIEGEIETMPGLGLLPVHTTLTAEKITRQCQFRYKARHELCEGYEIHMGISETEQNKPLTSSLSGQTDGYWLSDLCWGSYIHGILDNKIVIDDLLSRYLSHAHTLSDFIDTKTYKEQQYDQLAQHLRTHIDIAYIYQQLQS
ncbi:cobyric acid synthase [Xanthocytophaga agilis]|uniref:Cobyric acid synthase n=1 Tax=Xanthocytophaga agilis TaxID=3048010 RepID=A0AAE3R1Q4_9BACT|nr:cobyric acid synthase [Xanthocytophaga agilis]MDJ1499042.1 cobyric acid synthase [Xanthocytophaga agilis]